MKAEAHAPSRAAIGYVAPLQRLSASAQRAALRRWARAHALRLVECHIEREPEIPLAERPALMDALTSLGCHRANMLVLATPQIIDGHPVWQAVVEQLAAQAGGRIVYASEGNAAPAREPFGDALAAHGRMVVNLRMRTSAALKQPRGQIWGRCPWGYRLSDDGMTLIPYEPELNVVAVIRHARESGFKLREIADLLRDNGVVGRTGKPLSITRIFEILDENGDTKRGPRAR